jgi:toxin-antitoxin system PIN domain toxin
LIAYDTNLLVYAHRSESPFHDRARRCVKASAEGAEAWALAWPCLHEFLGIVTNPKIFKTPTPIELALKQVGLWLASPSVITLSETVEGYWPLLEQLVKKGQVRGAKIHDARVAALALLHGADELLTADRDFSRFPELKTRNPLVD